MTNDTISRLRQSASRIWQAALRAAEPHTCVRDALQLTGNDLDVEGERIPLNGRLIVVGAGKAGAAMAQAVEGILGDRIGEGLVITRYGHRLATERIEIVEAGHPVPDAAGVEAVGRLRKLVTGLGEADVVLCLISGGGSALMPDPAPGITLEEKQDVTTRLLRAGATIRELNAVRKHLSGIKGGQLVRWAAPARVISLIMSDVIGDPPGFIASGPTAADTSTYRDALSVLGRYGVEVTGGVRTRLDMGANGEVPETPKPGDPAFLRVSNHIVASNRLLVSSAADQARELGFNTLILTSGLEGEAADMGRLFAAIAREVASSGQPAPAPACILAAGETTVTVRGEGLGGRNLEMALAWGLAAGEWNHPACFASIASDGSDGPTEAAGGVVDPTTCARAAELGMDAAACLAQNDSFRLLAAVGDSVITGPTHTNLMDLQILLVD